MKRLFSLIVIGGLVLSLCACDKEEPDRSSQTEIETEAVETTESETVPIETSEVTESETTESETSEETSEETTTSESETEIETEPVKKEGGSLFVDCSGKSADQIVANIVAIRTINTGDTAESYADRFDIAPQWDCEYDEDSINIGYIWFPDMVGSNDCISLIKLDADFESERGEIIVAENSNVEITIGLSDFDTAKEIYEKVSYILAEDCSNDKDANYDDFLVEECDEEELITRCLVRCVSLKLEPNAQGSYEVYMEIDLVNS